MTKNLKHLFAKMSMREFPDFLEVMSAISDVTDEVTLTERPAERNAVKTICELNDKNCCGD